MRPDITDFVALKHGIQPDLPFPADNLAGEIVDVDDEENTYLVMLDSMSLEALPDAYLRQILQDEEGYPHAVDLPFTDVEPIEPRDTEVQRLAALRALANRLQKIAGTESHGLAQNIRTLSWHKGFMASPYADQLATGEYLDATDIIQTMVDFMYMYVAGTPEKWTVEGMQGLITQTFPRKIEAPDDYWDHMGPVLVPFFTYLGEENLLVGASEYARLWEEYGPRLREIAFDQENWGLTKSLLHGKDEALGQLEEFAFQKPVKDPPRLRKEDPFKGIGRNERIDVQYQDGTVVNGIKFKKVEDDLRAGKCSLL